MKFVHSMIRVLDEARSIDFYTRSFGLTLQDRYDFADFTLIYLRDDESSFELELTVNKDQKAPYALGDGYGHIAFTVADLDGLHARLVAEGLAPTPLKSIAHEGKHLARFFFLTDPDGYKIEVLQRGGRYL